MATEILAPATTAATSTPVTLTAGQTASLFLRVTGSEKPFEGVQIEVQFQNSDSTWSTVAVLVAPASPTVRFDGPATFRVKRELTRFAVGVEQA